jgi:hypothetical protein
VTYEEAVEILSGWVGSRVVVILPEEAGAVRRRVNGVSRRPWAGVLEHPAELQKRVGASAYFVIRTEPRDERLANPDGIALDIPGHEMKEARWVKGRRGSGLSLLFAGLRIDVFLDEPRS